MQLSPSMLPPGLGELAQQEGLTDAQTRKLAAMWDTIRGRRPRTVDEWMPLYRAVKPYLEADK